MALNFADSAFQIYKSLGDYSLMSGAGGNKAIDFILSNEVDSARKWFKLAMEYSTLSGDRVIQFNGYNNYGLFLDGNGDPDSSYFYLDKALSIALDDGLEAVMPSMYLSLGQSIEVKDPARALALYDTALVLAIKYELPRVKEKIIRSQIDLLYENNQDLGKVLQLYDSLIIIFKENHSLELAEKFADFEVKYEMVEKVADLVKANADIERRRITQRWVTSSFVLVVLLLALIIRGLLQKRKLSVREKEISAQKIDALLKTTEMEKLDDMLEFQEKERSRIAADLHDQLGSILSAVKLNFSSMEEKLHRRTTKPNGQYKVVKGLIDEAATEVRRIAHDMSSGVLANFGLVHAVYDLKKALEPSGKIKIDVFEHGMDERLAGTKEIAVYRVIQELVSNSLKHAKASKIDIHFTKVDDHLTVIVEDDGNGFVQKKKAQRGIGLVNIEKRVAEIDGTFTIDSNPKSGTTAIIDIVI